MGGLVQASDGDLYGATWTGGNRGYGTIYRLDLAGNFAVVRDFDGTADGGNPLGDLLEGSDGALYGTASTGGTGMSGTVFRMDSFRVVHHVALLHGPGRKLSEQRPGRGKRRPLLRGDVCGRPIRFRDALSCRFLGSVSLLHQFSGAEDGGHPLGGLLAAFDGHVYGTTVGVPLDAGTLFRVDVSGGYEVLLNSRLTLPRGTAPSGFFSNAPTEISLE